MKRLTWIICVLTALVCAFSLLAFAEEANVIVLTADVENMTVTEDTWIDLNGHNIATVTVTDGTLYCFDSATADYTVAIGGYGKIGTITGNVAASDGYMQIVEVTGTSFHRVNLEIQSMTLRSEVVGVYYTADFAGDEVVSAKVKSYGVALSVYGEPKSGLANCGFSTFYDFQSGAKANAAASGTLLKNILKPENSAVRNRENAKIDVFGRAYLKTDNGYVFGKTVTMSLKSLMEGIDEAWSMQSQEEQNAIKSLYAQYETLMGVWELPNLHADLYPVAQEKFIPLFVNRGQYLYRVGNAAGSTVKLNSLFVSAADASIDNAEVSVEISTLAGNATGVFTPNLSDWKQGYIQFSGAGIVKLSITDAHNCIPAEIQLEVVSAKNATTASQLNATTSNVVVLNDMNFGAFTVSSGYSLYGNGFTLTRTSDSVAKYLNSSYISLTNGTIDNVQIICPNFSQQILYKVQIGDGGSYNVNCAITANGNSNILNSYISGARTPVLHASGNLEIRNSYLYGGAVANIYLGAGNSLLLEDVTMVQEPITSADGSKTIMGFGVFHMADSGSPEITLQGDFHQYAWVCEEYRDYFSDDVKNVMQVAISQKDYIHPVLDGRDSLNVGFISMPETLGSTADLRITDNRSNKNTIPYEMLGVTQMTVTAKVYSYVNTKGTDAEFTAKPAPYTPKQNEKILPELVFADSNNRRVFTKEYDATEAKWKYHLTVNLDDGAYAFDFGKLIAEKYGNALSYTVTDETGNAVDKTKPIQLSSGTKTYQVAVADNCFYDAQGQLTGETVITELEFQVVATMTEIDDPVVVATAYEPALCVASSFGSTWHGAVPALEGIQIRYWSTAENSYKTVHLADYTPTTAGKQNGANNFWKYEGKDFVLTVTNATPVQSSRNVYAMPVVCEGKLYFTPASTAGLVNTGNTPRAISLTYTFTDMVEGSVTFSNSWSIAENQNTEYGYASLCSGTLEKLEKPSTCFASGSLVTMGDGSRKKIEEVNFGDEILAWDFFDGEYVSVPVGMSAFHGNEETNVIELTFSNGSTSRIIREHGFFSLDENRFVYLSEANAENYIGQRFATSQNHKPAVLTNVAVSKEKTGVYSIASAFHYNAIVDNMLTNTPAYYNGQTNWEFFNYYFPIGEHMKYDAAQLQADIETYGLYTYEEFAHIFTPEEFAALNIQYFKIPISKGQMTYEDLLDAIQEQIIDGDVELS